MSVHVKCCGLTRAEDVEAAVDTGVDYIGFVLARSPREVTVEQAGSLALVARGAGFEGGLVGVFVDASPQELERAAIACDLDVLQLHGNETPEMVSAATAIRPVWKTIGVLADPDAVMLTAEAARYPDAEAVLLDTGGLERPGGTGVAFMHAVAEDLVSKRHVFIAGGLTSDNVAPLVRALEPFGVDVSTGVESSPGVKDAAKLAAFVAAVRGAEATA